MHMADALVSPVVGGAMWAVSAGLIGHACRKIGTETEDRRIPLMGVMGAFTFAAQMVNFTIPGTGSSGHLGGGLLLSILLGPHAALLTMTSVLLVQALFFADGGILALGCNIFNLGFFPCFVVFPLIYRRLSPSPKNSRNLFLAVLISAVVALQLGAAGVVLETRLSGISELPLLTFALMMQPIHLAIGIAEAAATAAIVIFVSKARPDLLDGHLLDGQTAAPALPKKAVIITLAVFALLLGGIASQFASSLPDGLEWAIEKTAGETWEGAFGSVHAASETLQEKTAILPDYDFKNAPGEKESTVADSNMGTSTSGLVGGLITLVFTLLFAAVAYLRRKSNAAAPSPNIPR